MKRVAAVVLGGGLVLAALAWPVHAQEAVDGTGPRVGDGLRSWGQADFGWRLRTLDGVETTLHGYRGRALFINLWASWCTPCVRELESIEALRARLADTDVAFLAVAAEGEGPVRRFLRRHPYDLPFYLEARPAPPVFGVRGLPTTWVVHPDGRIVLLRHGAADWDTDEMERFLRALSG